MFWRRGWLLNTLNYQVEKQLRESIFSSEAYIENRWNIIEKQLIVWSKKPIHYVIKLFLTSIFFTAAIITLKPFSKSFIPGTVEDWQSFIEWQSTFLSGQLTILGVLFPLVIGLVGFLLQEKTASRAIWTVYNRYSGFMFTGFSGLGLSLVIITGKYFEPHIPIYWYLSVSICSSFWLIFNLLLTGWFLNATFKIIQERTRGKLLIRYTINESFIQDIKKRLSYLIPQQVIEKNLIDCMDDGKVEVETIRFSREGELTYSPEFSKKKYLGNISFRILNLSIYLLTKFNRTTINETEKPRIVIPETLDNRAKKKFDLLVYKGLTLNPLIKVLLRLSYSYTDKQPYPEDSLKDIIFSLVGASSDELKNHNIRLFKESIKSLSQWHCDVSDSLSFIDDNDNRDNWLLLPASGWGGTYFDTLLHEYYLLSQQAVEKIPQTIDFFNEISFLHLRLFAGGDIEQPVKIVNELIYGHYLVWSALLNWSTFNNKPKNSSIAYQYENALLAYVGAWEFWPRYIKPLSKPRKQSTYLLSVFIQHLCCTAQQIVVAFRKNDLDATEWAVDMLINWFSNVSLRDDLRSHYRWNHEILVHTIFDRNTDDKLWKLILNGHEFETTAAEQIALRNAWIDIRLITACYIMNNHDRGISESTEKIVDVLIHATRLRPTGDHDSPMRNLDTSSRILAAYIRHCWYWEYNVGSYGAWLDSIIERFNRIDEPKTVSGRIYSGSMSARGVRSLVYSYIKLIVKKSDSEWQLDQRWIQLLLKSPIEIKHRDNIIEDLNSWRDLIEKDKIDFGDEQKKRINNFKISIKKVIDDISGLNDKSIRNATIDSDRLKSFGKSASVTAFSKDSSGIPLSWFKEIIYNDTGLDQYKFTIKIDYPKKDISSGLVVNRTSIEESWFDDVTHQNLRINIFRALIKIKPTTSVQVDNDHSLILTRIVNDISQFDKNGGRPILFVSDQSLRSFLINQIYNTDTISFFKISRHNGYGRHYICHLENVPVYRLPFNDINYSILTSEEIFKTINFLKYQEDCYVQAEYDISEENDLAGTLKLSYWMEAEFADVLLIKYSTEIL